MSDPIKISIEAIFQFIFFSMSLYLSGLCGKLVNNSPAGVFVTWSAQDDPVWENLQTALTCEVLKIEIAGHSHHIKKITLFIFVNRQSLGARSLKSCGSTHDPFFVSYLTLLEQLHPNCHISSRLRKCLFWNVKQYSSAPGNPIWDSMQAPVSKWGQADSQ